MREEEQFMRRAIEIAREKMVGEGLAPFAAVVVRDGQIIGEGCNRVLVNHDPTAHGEVEAIRDACRRLQTYELPDSELYSSGDPCPLCVSSMYFAKIERLYYASTHDDYAALGIDTSLLWRELTFPVQERQLPSEQLLAVEARELLEHWTSRPEFAAHLATLNQSAT